MGLPFQSPASPSALTVFKAQSAMPLYCPGRMFCSLDFTWNHHNNTHCITSDHDLATQ